MRFLKLSFFAALVLSTILFSGCDGDDPVTVSPFVGNYVITEAKIIAITPAINTNELGALPVPVGTDITAAIQASLLSQVTCSSPDKSWVELREDKSMYMSCEGSNQLNAGTWEEVSATELKLNMNKSAIPSSEAGFALNVTDITINGATMSGKTGVPMPKAMIEAMVAQMGASIGLSLTLSANNPDIFVVSFTITFVKK